MAHIPTPVDVLSGAVPRGRTGLRTSSTDEAIAAVERLYGPHELVLNTQRGLDLRVAGFDVGRISVSSIEYGCPATGRPQRPSDFWVFSYVVDGESRVGGVTVGAGTACVRQPGAMSEVPMSADLRLLNLKVGHDDMRAAFMTLYGDAPDSMLRFDSRSSAGSHAALQFNSLLQRLQRLPATPSRFGALLERRWQESALLELLLTLPHADASRFEPKSTRRGAVDHAIERIDADPSAVISLGDLARSAGVGVRALTRAFERRLGIPPMRFVQQRRLDSARSALLDGQATVTEIAMRCGFGNLGDFALKYRARFGERPSETLRRTQTATPAAAGEPGGSRAPIGTIE